MNSDSPDSDSAWLRGARLFDEGAFFAAHEAWESRWRVATDPNERLLLQGLIQAAAAFHKLFVVGSVASAARLLGRALTKLEACQPLAASDGLGPASSPGADLLPFDLAAFREGLRSCALALDATTPAHPNLERTAIPRLLPPLSSPLQTA